jgi:hypothetical protein
MGVFTRNTLAASDPALIPPLDSPRPLTAATSRTRIDDRQAMERLRVNAEDRAWQTRAWTAYEAVGEVHFAFNLVSNIISRIRFFAAAEVTPNTAPAYVGDASDLTPGLAEAADAALRRLAHNQGDMSSLASRLALNLSVPGECYLVQFPRTDKLTTSGVESTPEHWEIRSIDEVQVSNDRLAPVRVRSRPDSPTSEWITLPKTAFIGRIWRQHPRWTALADSSMRAVLDLCDELLLVNQTFKATARSRLNSGLLYVPDGLSASNPTFFPDATPPDPLLPPSAEPTPPPGDADEFEQALVDGMMVPIQDPSDASAVVPILVRGPADLGEKIRLINFERTFDPSLVQRSDRVLDRILQGIDLPKDVVSGLANVRYSNAIQIEESLFKAHIQPLTLLVCDALTDIYLRPALRAAGYTQQQAERVRIWYDPSEVVTRPNRNQDAISNYDRYALSGRALREATGFNEDDAPTPTEVVMRLLFQKGPMTPELAESLLRTFAPNLLESARQAGQAASDNPLPPEVSDILDLTPGAPQAEAEAEEPLPPSAAESLPSVALAEPTPPPTPPKVQGPRPAAPAVTPENTDTGIPGLPPSR